MMNMIVVPLLIISAFMGVPLFLIIAGGALYGYYVAGDMISGIFIEVYKIATNPVLMAIPLFTFAGYLMAESKTPQRIINLSRALLGWLPGGVPIVVLISCAFFTAFTGASGVTIIALGGLLLPVLLKEGYKEKFSLGLLTTSGSLGLLFPPSLPVILYAVIAGSAYSGLETGIPITVDKLFLASLLPGILLMIVLAAYGIRNAGLSMVPRQSFNFKMLLAALKEAKWEVPLPVIVLWGIYGGYFTASEASAITALYVLLVEMFIYKEISFRRELPKIIKESSVLVGGIIVIIGMALSFTNYLIEQEVPAYLVSQLKLYITSKFAFLLVLNVFLLIVGCMMDIFSAILVVVPLIIPIAHQYGVNPLHLGVIFLVNLEIGYLTPPVGLNLFIASFRFKKPLVDIYRVSIPYIILLILCLIVITYVPWLSLVFV